MEQLASRAGLQPDNDLEPGIAALLDRKALHGAMPAYRAKRDDEVSTSLTGYFAEKTPGSRITDLRRMGGGASKEQFVFNLECGDGSGRYVLRMDPLGAAVETDRLREFEVIRAVAAIVPVPRPAWIDVDGKELGAPAMIMEFAEGVTKPSGVASGGNVSGLGTLLSPHWRKRLGPQFVKHLVALHSFDWRSANLPSLQVPDTDPRQAARWQANWWSRVWRDDKVASLPVAALAEAWMLDNLPEIDGPDLVLVHADYRTGNYLFNETSGDITAILDWELAHIGDYHEDLGWAVQRVFGVNEGGRFYASGLYERAELLDLYEQASGRRVDRKTLHFYEVLAAFKCVGIILARGMKVASRELNHQDILLNWLAAAGHIFHAELCKLLENGPST